MFMRFLVLLILFSFKFSQLAFSQLSRLVVKTNEIKSIANLENYRSFVNQMVDSGFRSYQREIKKGETLNSIIYNVYGVTDKYDSLHEAITQKIVEINSIRDPAKIFYKSKIVLPIVLGYQFSNKASNEYIQTFDMAAGVFKLANIHKKNIENSWGYNVKRNHTNLATFNFSPSLLDSFFIDSKNKKLIFQLMEESAVSFLSDISSKRIVDIKISDCKEELIHNDIKFTIPKDSLLIDLSSLSEKDFGEFQVFDVFRKDSSCTHGRKVVDVINQVLSQYSLSFASKKIIEIPINYFSNKSFAESILRKYNETRNEYLPDYDQTPISSIIPSKETCDMYENNDTKTPENYLSALFNTYLERSPDIISNSYTVFCSSQRFLPIIVSDQKNMDRTNYFTSVTNDNDDFVENYIRSIKRGDDPIEFLEPLYSFMNSREQVGTVIVGGALGIDSIYGMKCKTGINISALGQCTSWGDRCIRKHDIGTSFSTPAIAAKLFVAKAFWRKNNLSNIGSIEARKRLLLASNVNPAYIGKCASGGDININKLLQIKKGYIVKNNDEIIPIDSIKASYISYLNSRGGVDNLEFKCSLEEDEEKYSSLELARGLYYLDKRYYILKDRNEQWVEFSNPSLLILNVFFENNSVQKTLTLSDFKKDYKQFVLLNN